MALDHTFINELSRMTFGAAYSALTIVKLKELKVPFPHIDTQRQIVSRIENEQALVNANKELITIFEGKIKERIAKVWGETAPNSLKGA
jgi:type I restriction enzyme M protein